MITVYETPIKNSGVTGGKFLERTRVAKPGSTPEKPQFYGPQDFSIGAVVHIFRHRFLITNADAFVLSYMEQHPQQFSGMWTHSAMSISQARFPSKRNRLRWQAANCQRKRLRLARFPSKRNSRMHVTQTITFGWKPGIRVTLMCLPTLTLSVGVGKIYARQSVCLSVRSITRKRIIPKCSNFM